MLSSLRLSQTHGECQATSSINSIGSTSDVLAKRCLTASSLAIVSATFVQLSSRSEAISDCSMARIMEWASSLVQKSHAGAWNDLDMLEVGNGGMTRDEYSKIHVHHVPTHFGQLIF